MPHNTASTKNTSKHTGKTSGYATVTAAQPLGANATLISVEADVARGLHAFSIVGLADRAVEESRDRIAAAIRHAGFMSPKSDNRRITLSLSPADMRKEGSHYDVPLALCYLVATGDIPALAHTTLCTGELSLDGTLRGVRGVLSQVRAAHANGITTAYVPPENAIEASLVSEMEVYAPKTLTELIEHLNGERELLLIKTPHHTHSPTPDVDFSMIKGQESAKRALEIAAAGRHNIVLYGPPGTGKTLLAKALPGILPPLTEEEVLEVTAIHSTAGILNPGSVVYWPPFRAPHHTASHVAMVGGGTFPHAGEMTLAHKGILFLDEFPEFATQTLEALRQPLEERCVTISRTKATITFPADCMVVAAMNPAHTVTDDASLAIRTARKQARKISRPIADRLEMWVEVPAIPHETLGKLSGAEVSRAVQKRVRTARDFALEQYKSMSDTEREVSQKDLSFSKRCSAETRDTLVHASKKLDLSARGYYRTLRLAHTIANLEHSPKVTKEHIFEALQYRPREMFGFS
ncbi:MAG TPA: ATP-binding protein [Candidatus Kaiserbacteria bacterium]|nr:ATP-binding protein [Candidatus Kaiserbacteria bacterium]